MKLKGSFPALITPFTKDGIDEPALRRQALRMARGGSAGLVPCGTTGEASTLSAEEYRRIISIVRDVAQGKIPVIAGAGTNSTEKTCAMAQIAAEAGADALLLVSPYYNKPTQEGLFLHFRQTAQSVRIPIILYNIPGRTSVNILPETIFRLARACPNIIGVKEASGSLDQVSAILRLLPAPFAVLSGDDSLTLPMLALGAQGVISVAANLFPKELSRLCSSFHAGDLSTARKIHSEMFPLIKALFLETNPIPIKAAAAKMGYCENILRLPLTPISPDARKVLEAELRKFRGH